MKKMTIALFAIMLTAGFAMADDDVIVTLTVLEYDFVEIVGGDFTINVTPDPTATNTMDFTVDYETNNGMNLEYTFTPDWTGTDLSVDAIGGESVGIGSGSITKSTPVNVNLNVLPGNYTGTLLVDIL